jgi:hypothetical protein
MAAAMPALGHEVAAEILKALKIDPENVVSVALDCQPSSLAAVTIRREITTGEAKEIGTLIQQFEVIRGPLPVRRKTKI